MIYNDTKARKITFNGKEVKTWIHDGVEVFSSTRIVTIKISAYVTYIKWNVTEKDGTVWSGEWCSTDDTVASEHTIEVGTDAIITWSSSRRSDTNTRDYYWVSQPDETVVTDDIPVSFTVDWQVQYYTVKFVDWNGSHIVTKSTTYGGSVTTPADPTRTGYTFSGWSGSWTNVTENQVVTATYTVNTYKLTYYFDVPDRTYEGVYTISATVDGKTSSFTSWQYLGIGASCGFEIPGVEYGKTITINSIKDGNGTTVRITKNKTITVTGKATYWLNGYI